MPFTNDPTIARDRIRLMIGDTDPVIALVDDAWYDYYLTQYNNNEKTTAIEIAKKILAMYANNASRERVDQVERYGQEQFDSYLKWLKDLISDPNLGLLGAPMPYLGGSSKSDMRANDLVPDNVRPSIPKVCRDDGYATLEDPFRFRE